MSVDESPFGKQFDIEYEIFSPLFPYKKYLQF